MTALKKSHLSHTFSHTNDIPNKFKVALHITNPSLISPLFQEEEEDKTENIEDVEPVKKKKKRKSVTGSTDVSVVEETQETPSEAATTPGTGDTPYEIL